MTAPEAQPSTRELILEQAEALFMRQGISGTSLADIASAAGISKGTLFYHFRSKEDLILEIASEHIDRVERDILAFLHEQKQATLDLPGLLEHFLAAVQSATIRNRLHLYLLEEGLSRNPAIVQALRERYNEWKETIRRELEGFVGDEAVQIAPLVLAMADGLIIQGMLGLEMPDLHRALSVLLRGCPEDEA